MSEINPLNETVSYENVQIVAVVEAILHVADEPLEPRALAATLGFTEETEIGRAHV